VVAQIWYASLEDVMATADVADSAHLHAEVARNCDAAAAFITALTKRVFYPEIATRYFEWPQDWGQSTRRLYLDRNELAAKPTAVVTGVGDADTSIPLQYVNLAPGEGPGPYDTLVLDNNSPAVFQRGSTPERSIAVTGEFISCPVVEERCATTASVLAGTTLDVSSSARIGTGTLLRVGSERLVVTARSWLSTGNVEPITIGKDMAVTSFTVTSGTSYEVGEELLLDAERMKITGIAGNTLLVRRAVNGSVLAAHTATVDVYAQRRLTVDRAQLGTTAADTVSSGDTVWRFRFPGLVVQLFIAEAVVGQIQGSSGWARTAGSGDNTVESIGKGLVDLRKQVCAMHRRYRWAAV
jgi:hypothetical protein